VVLARGDGRGGHESKYAISLVVAFAARPASRCILSVFSAVKYPFLSPAPAQLWVSVSDERAIVRNLAKSRGQYRAKPSAMFRVADDDESLI
jgi:hypothetical protein